jgi:hypothetical protein
MEKEKIIVLIPTKKNINKELLNISLNQEDKFIKDAEKDNTYEIKIIRDFSGPGDENLISNNTIINISKFPERVKHMCNIRQNLIEKYVLPNKYDYVLWIDSDIIKYDYSILKTLIDISKKEKAITAPKIFLDGFKERFYDIAGFIINNKWSSIKKPYFGIENQSKQYVELDSVGCFYLVPAEIYYKGGNYIKYQNLKFTEHYSICKFGKEMGYKSICCSELEVLHALLYKFNESLH